MNVIRLFAFAALALLLGVLPLLLLLSWLGAPTSVLIGAAALLQMVAVAVLLRRLPPQG